MQKVIVIGCPGSGKSTFSRKLHDMMGIPLFHLDMLNWDADKTPVAKSIFYERLSHVMEHREWIIDGNYGSTMELRMQKCDTVIFLDYPLEICLSGIEVRKGKPRPDMPWVEATDVQDAELIEFVKNYRVQSRPLVMDLLNKYSDRDIYPYLNTYLTNP